MAVFILFFRLCVGANIHAFCLSDYFTSWKLLFHATFHWLNRGSCCVWHLQHLTHVFIARLKGGHAREGHMSQQHSKYTSTTQPQQLTTPAQQPHKEHTATTRQPHSCHTATTEQSYSRAFTNGLHSSRCEKRGRGVTGRWTRRESYLR